MPNLRLLHVPQWCTHVFSSPSSLGHERLSVLAWTQDTAFIGVLNINTKEALTTLLGTCAEGGVLLVGRLALLEIHVRDGDTTSGGPQAVLDRAESDKRQRCARYADRGRSIVLAF